MCRSMKTSLPPSLGGSEALQIYPTKSSDHTAADLHVQVDRVRADSTQDLPERAAPGSSSASALCRSMALESCSVLFSEPAPKCGSLPFPAPSTRKRQAFKHQPDGVTVHEQELQSTAAEI